MYYFYFRSCGCDCVRVSNLSFNFRARTFCTNSCNSNVNCCDKINNYRQCCNYNANIYDFF